MAKKLEIYKCEACGNIVEVVGGGKAYRQFLEPGEQPKAFFPVDAKRLTAREYCNLHGLWKVTR